MPITAVTSGHTQQSPSKRYVQKLNYKTIKHTVENAEYQDLKAPMRGSPQGAHPIMGWAPWPIPSWDGHFAGCHILYDMDNLHKFRILLLHDSLHSYTHASI